MHQCRPKSIQKDLSKQCRSVAVEVGVVGQLLLVAAALGVATLTTATGVARSSVVVGIGVGGCLSAGWETAGAHATSGLGLLWCQKID